MIIREQMELLERTYLSPFATLSENSKGRDIPEEECDIRPVFQRDRDRILHCKSFRRLKHKTQVFLSPRGDHYRTRLTHTLEVSQTARTIAKALRLNEDLVEAIALGHDLGHTPYGHAGEAVLDRLCESGFKHSEQSVRIVEKLENEGKGLNLTWEVRDGILNHQTSSMPSTLEGKIVRLSDKIAYIHHDIDDAIRAHVMTEEDVPMEYREILGMTSKIRLDTLIHDIISHSRDKNDIWMVRKDGRGHERVEKIYVLSCLHQPESKGGGNKGKGNAGKIVFILYGHCRPLCSTEICWKRESRKTGVVCDYIAGMTDQYAAGKFQEYFIPKSWQVY